MDSRETLDLLKNNKLKLTVKLRPCRLSVTVSASDIIILCLRDSNGNGKNVATARKTQNAVKITMAKPL
jgi:hypothetical protein